MRPFNKSLLKVSAAIAGTAIFVLAIVGLFTLAENTQKISALESALQKNASSTESQIEILQKQISILSQSLLAVTGENQKVASSLKELANRQTVAQKSQQDLVTAAVAKVTPSVVSVVAVKDVPQYEVVYQNPFGNDPLFKDFNIQVPVLKQKGTAPSQVSAGTGFFTTSDGYIVTNKHVVADQGASYTAFLPDGTKQNVTVIYRDPTQDVAVLKVPGQNYKAVSFGESGSLKLGQTVIAVGNALGEYNNTVSIGIISGLNRTITASDPSGANETLNGVIQTDAAINPGNSGGPLVNLEGDAIGVNVATIVGSSNISFSIPIDVIKGTLQKVLGRNF
jgi:S1-C subfamily serine protease